MTCNKGFRLCHRKLWSWDDLQKSQIRHWGCLWTGAYLGVWGTTFGLGQFPRGVPLQWPHIKQCTHQLDPSTAVLTGVWTGPQSFQYRRCLEPFSHYMRVSKGDNPWPHRRGNLQAGGVSVVFFFLPSLIFHPNTGQPFWMYLTVSQRSLLKPRRQKWQKGVQA